MTSSSGSWSTTGGLHLHTWAGSRTRCSLPPGATARLLAEFSDYADASSPYVFHCHLLAHEDNGIMGQFVVVEVGGQQRCGRPAGTTDDASGEKGVRVEPLQS